MRLGVKTFCFLAIILVQLSLKGQSIDDLVDIRPEIIKKEGDFVTGHSEREKKGQEILDLCFKAHGWDRVSSVKTITAIYNDDWSPALEQLKAYNNWPLENQKVRHDFYAFQLGFSRVKLLNGPGADEIWGIDNNIPYKRINQELSVIDDANMIPALVGKEYFIQLPYWINKIPLVNYIEDRVMDGKTYHLVYGTWKSGEANTEFDQYIFWINKETKILELVQYTVRVVSLGASGFVVFDDFNEVNGVTIPFRHKLGYLPTKKGLIHEMIFESIIFDSKDITDKEIRVLSK
ncbi:hypothetical protein DKG77_06275 [Flagellimonas aquimarina]|uniref:Uncharacterized protein n=1 Tax=Flagellimonas aquimarina TaxID=2201895 RepID=A0A316L1M3_9FLAO|nr:hypothetical protein [Allomuricauda koreensis]PWL40417.1 hypothetical protein DKG77_06275 [Allomuricauda koreensis]